jgi:hypothetical protein
VNYSASSPIHESHNGTNVINWRLTPSIPLLHGVGTTPRGRNAKAATGKCKEKKSLASCVCELASVAAAKKSIEEHQVGKGRLQERGGACGKLLCGRVDGERRWLEDSTKRECSFGYTLAWLSSRHHISLSKFKGPFSCEKFWEKISVALFVVIW